MNNHEAHSVRGKNHPTSSSAQEGSWLCDKMDTHSEWDLAQQQNMSAGYGFGPQISQSFEFDIHDCSVSEVNR
ncbi:YodD family protein [Pantoea alhagi]|uniref:YodD family protein n=1 Tax=Pantoea alhagi TaxID=1891675 RepID=UPI00202ADCFB|nr:YodD family protein [Pantoea alhagi]URQ59518.1 YodD family protein [Pantoea alhagi]